MDDTASVKPAQASAQTVTETVETDPAVLRAQLEELRTAHRKLDEAYSIVLGQRHDLENKVQLLEQNLETATRGRPGPKPEERYVKGVWFPIQDEERAVPGKGVARVPGGRIPWRLAEIAYRTYGRGGQTLERLAERGGWGWVELLALLRGEYWSAAGIARATDDFWPETVPHPPA